MIDRLSEQLRNETPRHSYGYMVLSILTMMIFTGWFIYHGVTNYAQAQTPTITGSYTSPVISLNLADGDYVTSIIGTNITATVPTGATTDYQFSFYDVNKSVIISDVSKSALSSLSIDTLAPVKAFSFTATLSATDENELPVVDSVKLLYTADAAVPDPEDSDPTEQHIPNLSITFLTKVDYGLGVADSNLPFHFYFFKENALTPIFTSAPATTYSLTTNQYVGGPIRIDSSKLEEATYKAYVKTTKHLSSQSSDVVIGLIDGIGPTTKSVELNFGTLKAGDIGGNSLPYGSLSGRDDSVTASDWAIFEGLFGSMGEIVTTLLGDFNNDKSVNVHDLWPFRSQDNGGSYQLDGGL